LAGDALVAQRFVEQLVVEDDPLVQRIAVDQDAQRAVAGHERFFPAGGRLQAVHAPLGDPGFDEGRT